MSAFAAALACHDKMLRVFDAFWSPRAFTISPGTSCDSALSSRSFCKSTFLRRYQHAASMLPSRGLCIRDHVSLSPSRTSTSPCSRVGTGTLPVLRSREPHTCARFLRSTESPCAHLNPVNSASQHLSTMYKRKTADHGDPPLKLTRVVTRQKSVRTQR